MLEKNFLFASIDYLFSKTASFFRDLRDPVDVYRSSMVEKGLNLVNLSVVK